MRDRAGLPGVEHGGSLGRLTPAEADRYVALARRHIEKIEAAGGPPREARPRWDEGKRILAAVETALANQELGVFPAIWISRALQTALAALLGWGVITKGPELVGSAAQLLKFGMWAAFGVLLYRAATVPVSFQRGRDWDRPPARTRDEDWE